LALALTGSDKDSFKELSIALYARTIALKASHFLEVRGFFYLHLAHLNPIRAITTITGDQNQD
jgi:hypothetical protein